jgi:hypothetical protein
VLVQARGAEKSLCVGSRIRRPSGDFTLLSAEFTAIIASATAIGGIFIKIAYDSVVGHISSKRIQADKFLMGRKAAYDGFLAIYRQQVKSREFLYELSLIARAHKEVKPGVIENAPPSAMSDLVESFQTLRRLARTNRIVEISQRMIALHGDASAALRKFLTDDSLCYGLEYFLACRLQEDQELEFIANYREDLGLKPPVGAAKTYPMAKRPWPLPLAEHFLHIHLNRWPKEIGQASSAKSLTEKDLKRLNSPRLKALIADETPEPAP